MTTARRRVLFCFGAMALLLAPSPAGAEDVKEVGVHLTVSHASNDPGQIDAKAQYIHRLLQRDFAYQSLRVVQTKSLRLQLNQVGSHQLPNGKTVRVRPMDVGDNGALIAVDVEGVLKTDLRVPNRKQVLIGSERYKNGKLIIMLEPRY